MRILAIRGHNLASLAEPFALEFHKGPLASAGLFAITGPTGSGKSTLLDAMCAALFDATPRLNAKSSVLVGRAGEDDAMRVGMSDVRALLRRGAGEGMAQVDFLGADGLRYRATWRVRRARDSPDGRLQPQTVELVGLADGKVIGGTKTQTLVEISLRLGLTFEQFRRSALLAQGDFAAFVTAPSGERAALLERMTGTELYSAVSRAAHLRRAFEREQIALLEAQVDVLGTSRLSAEALAEDESSLAEAKRQEAVLNGSVERWQAHEGHAAAAVPLVENVGQAETVCAEAEAVFLSSLRGWSLERLEEVKPQVHAQRGRLEALAEALKAAASGEVRAAQYRLATTAEVARSEAVLVRTRAELVEIQGAVDATPWAVPLVPQWARLCLELEQVVMLIDALGRLDAGREQLLAARDRSVGTLETAQAALVARGVARSNARQHLEREDAVLIEHCATLASAVQSADLSEDAMAWGGADSSVARSVVQALDELLGAVGALAVAEANLEVAMDAQAESLTAVERCRENLATLARETIGGAARLEEAALAAEQLAIPASLDAHRASLKPGESCPLCGAQEHPWATEAHRVLSHTLETARARVTELRGEHLQRTRQQAAQTESQRQHQRQAETQREAAVRLQTLVEQATEVRTAMAEAFAQRFPGVPQPLLEGDGGAVTGTLEGLLAAWRRLAERLEAYEALTVAVVRAEQSVLEATIAHQPTVQALLDDDRERGRLTDRISDELQRLEPVMAAVPQWPTAFRAAPAPWLGRIGERLTDVARHLESVEHKTASLAQAEAAAELAVATAAAATAEHVGACDGLQAATRALEASEAQLNALTAPMLAQEFEAFEVSVRGAQSALEQSTAVAQERRMRLAEHLACTPPAPEPTDGESSVEVRERRDAIRERRVALAARLAAHEQVKAQLDEKAEALAQRKVQAAPWLALGDLIGHHDGKTFRLFAQSLTLDLLVAHANRHLEDLARRFQLMRVPGYDLELQVVDRDLGDDVRTIRSLSGGETFLVSLALALSLSSVSAATTHVKTLFIDEGFGTLDPASLEMALSALDALQASGCQVGVISHVPGLAERMGTQVAVEPRGAGRSVLTVVTAR